MKYMDAVLVTSKSVNVSNAICYLAEASYRMKDGQVT